MDGDGTTTPVAGRASAVGVYDPSNARDALRFVSEMLQAGTAEEVVQQVLLSDQREQWSAALSSLVDDDEKKSWSHKRNKPGKYEFVGGTGQDPSGGYSR